MEEKENVIDKQTRLTDLCMCFEYLKLVFNTMRASKLTLKIETIKSHTGAEDSGFLGCTQSASIFTMIYGILHCWHSRSDLPEISSVSNVAKCRFRVFTVIELWARESHRFFVDFPQCRFFFCRQTCNVTFPFSFHFGVG